MLAPVFQPLPVFNDSVLSCSSLERGMLSRVDKEGRRLSVKHPLSLEGFRHGLTDCPDTELVRFVLDGIRDGVCLGSRNGAVDADPWRCRNG